MSDAPITRPPGGAALAGDNRRVLFVDDDAMMRRAFARAVSVGSLQVDLASCGNEALRLARRTEYAVVVTDLRMPGMDGVTLIDRLRPSQPGTQVILLTGTPASEIVLGDEQARAIGAILQKPCDTKTLLETVSKAVEVGLAPAAADAPRVLLLEDDIADRLLVERRLRPYLQGGKPVVAGSLAEAVSLLHDQPFDVILSDLSLPDAAGLETVRRLGTAAPSSTLVVLTGFEDDDMALRAVQLGAQDFIPKASLSAERLSRALRFAVERTRAARRLAHMAYYDQLTGLANRAMLRARVAHALASARRSGDGFALIYVDLDSFKPVNDTFGHDVGDELLQDVATRLTKAVRPCDLVARIGGDEFAVVVENLGTESCVECILERLRSELDMPALIGGHTMRISASMGVAGFPGAADSVDALIRRADQAMYRAKHKPGTAWELAATAPANRADRREQR